MKISMKISVFQKLLLAAAFAFFMSILPSMGMAADVAGSVTIANVAPSINSVVLRNAADTADVTAMIPQTLYKLKITVTDNNKLSDLSEIQITAFHDTTTGFGTPAAFSEANFDPDQTAFFKWSAPSTWTIVKNASVNTSWVLDASSTPVLDNVTGTFVLTFKPGKLAQAAAGTDTDEWNFRVYVKDSANATATNDSTKLKSMAAYIEMSTSVSSLGFSAVGMGAQKGVQFAVATNVLTNKAYALKVRSTGNWALDAGNVLTLNTAGTPTGAQFSLAIDDDWNTNFPTTPQWLTTSDAVITNYGAVAAPTVAPNASEAVSSKGFHAGIKIGGEGIKAGNYTGNITFVASN